MNIEMGGAQKASVVCWRELLRHLNTLNSAQLSGGKHKTIPEINFVAYGAQHPQLMDPIVAFMLEDFALDSETRQEIFLSNVRDAIDLNLFKNLPNTVVEYVIDKNVANQLKEFNDNLKEIKQNILMFDSHEHTHKMSEEYKQHKLELKIRQSELVLTHARLLEHEYLIWACQKILEQSVVDCQHMMETTDRVGRSLFVSMHINSVEVVPQSEHSAVSTGPVQKRKV